MRLSASAPRCQVRRWLWLPSCQLALHVVLPGFSSTLQHLRALLCRKQLPGLVRGVWLGIGVELNVMQDLQW